MSQSGVFSGPHFPVFGSEKAPYLGTFHAVKFTSNSQVILNVGFMFALFLPQMLTRAWVLLLPPRYIVVVISRAQQGVLGFRGYLRSLGQTLVLWISAVRGVSVSHFRDILTGAAGISGLGGTGPRAMILSSFRIYSDISLSRSATRSAIRIVCTSIYHALFHLWWKENSLDHQKVSKYYEHDWLQKVFLFFMSFLTAC